MEILDSYRGGRASRVQPTVNETETAQDTIMPFFNCENCGQDARFHNGVSCEHHTEPTIEFPCRGWERISLESNCATCGRIGYSERCKEGCENQNWVANHDLTGQRSRYRDLLVWRGKTSVEILQIMIAFEGEEHHEPEGWDNQPNPNDDLQTAGEYVQSVEAIRRGMETRRPETTLENPLQLDGEVQPDVYQAMAHGVFAEGIIPIRNLSNGIIIQARIQAETNVGERGKVMYANNIPYFCKIVDEENNLESYIQRVLDMQEITREVYNSLPPEYQNVIQQEARMLQGRSELEGMYDPLIARVNMDAATQRAMARFVFNRVPTPPAPKPTEQELLQQKVDQLIAKIDSIEHLMNKNKNEIKEHQGLTISYEQDITEYQGELELLTNNLTVNDKRQLVPKEVEDCPHLTVTSLPLKRKWWQLWKPKVMPGVELVL